MSNPQQRLISLDAFRGATIAGMILVNNPGTWSAIYPQLRHAAWHGWTFTDFIFPFFLLMSRHAKRTHPGRLKLGAMWTLVMHLVERYWLVMPNLYPNEYSFHWMDAACVMAVGGIFFAVVFWRMTKHALIPVGDPRLLRSIHFQNA